MVNDPYKVLDVPPGAELDEVKRAYRRKAKEYHPDMHPDDPEAGRKMNEINEAYDMILNPEKYRQRQAQQEQQRQYSQQARQQYEGGYGEWTGGFGFEDFFSGFGGFGAESAEIPRPQPRAGDSGPEAAAVRSINSGLYRQAQDQLDRVPGTLRGARWYYLSALANYGLGNRVAAWEQIEKAAGMEPGNAEYAAVKRAMSQDARSYEQRRQGMHIEFCSPTTICMGICFAQFCCNNFCRFGFYM